MGFLDNQQESVAVEQPQDTSSYMPMAYNIQANPQPADVIKYRLESGDILLMLEHDLKGEVFDENKQLWVKKYDAWINDEGISAIKSLISNYVHRGVYLAKLEPEQIDIKCLRLKIQLSRFLFKKYQLYEIDKAKRNLLKDKISDLIHLSLTRSNMGHESSAISQTTTQSHVIHETKDANNKGWNPMSFLPFQGK